MLTFHVTLTVEVEAEDEDSALGLALDSLRPELVEPSAVLLGEPEPEVIGVIGVDVHQPGRGARRRFATPFY